MTRPVALTLAGADPTGGAGLQADLKTFAAHGVHGLSVVTVLTAQNATRFEAMPVPAAFIRAQAEALFSDHAIGAIKIGMLAGADCVAAVVDILQRHNAQRQIPVVLDPILRASAGGSGLDEEAFALLKAELLPLATLVKPNLGEAARLLGLAPAADIGELRRQAQLLLALGSEAVLLSGGHLGGRDAADVLATGNETRLLAAPRSAAGDVHGTGCTLTAAIAANLAKGGDLTDAVANAKIYIGELYAGELQCDRAGRPISFDHTGSGGK